jgi:hypothetical protein
VDGGFIRAKARELYDDTEDWPIEKVYTFVEEVYEKYSDYTMRFAATMFMMCRFYEVEEDPNAIDLFRNWMRHGIISDEKTLVMFSEYVLLKMVNYNTVWQ